MTFLLKYNFMLKFYILCFRVSIGLLINSWKFCFRYRPLLKFKKKLCRGDCSHNPMGSLTIYIYIFCVCMAGCYCIYNGIGVSRVLVFISGVTIKYEYYIHIWQSLTCRALNLIKKKKTWKIAICICIICDAARTAPILK